MRITSGKIVALGIAVVYVMAAWYSGGPMALWPRLLVVFPLVLICFPEAVAGITGWGHRVAGDVHPALISLAGWFFLIGYPLIVYLLNRGR